MAEPRHQIRALYTASTVTVYQAYLSEIGLPAARDGRLPAAWQQDRVTWIKPSFLWMMYRCGWGSKDGQETVLAIEITREGFEWALEHAWLAHYEHDLHPDRATWKRRSSIATGSRPRGPTIIAGVSLACLSVRYTHRPTLSHAFREIMSAPESRALPTERKKSDTGHVFPYTWAPRRWPSQS
ncbi:DUF4291 family protein [Streptomyces sp. NPDC006333]|uniref:DUF4291 family protein n=1 Tax=Streptomyces sp. NPDC006333 TaxID=3156753 RepID=UPI00339DAB35